LTVHELVYKAQNRAIRGFYKAFDVHPSSAPYVSGDSFRAMARHRLEPGTVLDGRRVAAGDIVFVKADELPRFREEVLPHIRERFVLISHNSDSNIDERYADIADDERVICWFAQNAVLRHEKLKAVPIGLENRRLRKNGIIGDYDRLRAKSNDKRKRILYAFSVDTNRKERDPAAQALWATPYADGPGWMDNRRYWETLTEYAFVASPPGNGIDCHRTWEAMYLGTIPIVRRSPFYDAFPGLPVLAVDDWNEIRGWDENFLKKAYEERAEGLSSCPYLWLDYWTKRIAEYGTMA